LCHYWPSKLDEEHAMAVEILRVTESGNPKPVGKGVIFVEYNDLAIQFSEPRGYGDTVFSAVIKPDQFETLARAMLRAHPKEAIRAFGEALRRGIPAEPLDPMKRWRPEWEDAA
jgi:hypothetical protein